MFMKIKRLHFITVLSVGISAMIYSAQNLVIQVAPQQVNDFGIHNMVKKGDVKKCLALVRVNIQERGNIALREAVSFGRWAIVEALLDSRVDPNIKDLLGVTVLMKAAEKGDKQVVKKILNARRTDANIRDPDGNTSIMMAARNNYAAVVEIMLLKGKIDRSIKNNAGETIDDIAESRPSIRKVLDAFKKRQFAQRKRDIAQKNDPKLFVVEEEKNIASCECIIC